MLILLCFYTTHTNLQKPLEIINDLKYNMYIKLKMVRLFMNICFMCDLHLPSYQNAMQYNVLDWAISDIKIKRPNCIVFAGDVTCDGNADVYVSFIEKMKTLSIPFLYIPGNSDLRDNSCKDKIKDICSPIETIIDGTKIIAVNDSDKTICDQAYTALNNVDENSIVFMHHPLSEHNKQDREKLLSWREKHANVLLFYGHLHYSSVSNNQVSLQALDPDKAIGECPCLTYYNTQTKDFTKSHFSAPLPSDLPFNLGLSVYDAKRDVEFAIDNQLKNLELRHDCIDDDVELLQVLLKKWRNSGGENLSIHLPEISYKDGEVVFDKHFDRLLAFAKEIHADRFTQHVPLVSVKTIDNDSGVLDKIAFALSKKLNTLNYNFTLGVENMHMTPHETPDDTRRFGYTPEECLSFMFSLKEKCKFSVGINFDIGHARNNAPFSQKYQISTWLSLIGKYAVGYHIHQVTLSDDGFENHMPITEFYGSLISYASFFWCWDNERINKAPVIFEMRPENAYPISLKTFKN